MIAGMGGPLMERILTVKADMHCRRFSGADSAATVGYSPLQTFCYAERLSDHSGRDDSRRRQVLSDHESGSCMKENIACLVWSLDVGRMVWTACFLRDKHPVLEIISGA